TSQLISGSVSNSDQIVFLFPVKEDSGKESVSFVMDKIYGASTPSILYGHIDIVIKKARELKNKFPSLNISIFVTEAALLTAGPSYNGLRQKYNEKGINLEEATVEVDAPSSPFGDRYIEFGGPARKAGKRQVHGVLIRV